MSIFREPGSQIIAQLSVPVRGTWNSLAVHTAPTDALYDSSNIFLRRGKVRNRPGLTLVNDTVFDGPILGGQMAVSPQDKRLVVLSRLSTYELGPHDSAWAQVNTGAFAPSDTSVIDTAGIETSGLYAVLVAEEHNVLKAWNSLLHTTNTITPQSGSDPIPFAKSVCVTVRRVVVLVPPHTVRWSRVFQMDYFPPNAYNKVAQTNDMGICVRLLTNTSFALYKERSIYVARAREGNDDTAFQFSDPLYVAGPAGIKAIIDVSGTHIYMTKNGRIAQFSGAGYPQWIADGLWLFLQDDIDPLYAYLTTGVYDYRLHTAIFYYPRLGSGGALTGMVILSLPLEGVDLQQQQPLPAVFKGTSSIPVSHGVQSNFNGVIDRSVVFGSAASRQSFYLDETAQTDNGQYYDCMMYHPLTAMPDARHTKVSFETFVERSQGYGVLNVEPVVSDTLESQDGTTPDGKVEYIDLETNPVQTIKAFNISTRFFGLKYTWRSDSTVRYSGSVIYKSNR